MSHRLASLKGPSTPSKSPISQAAGRHVSPTPASPPRTTESPYHRKLRSSLQELRYIAHTWHDLILVDGLKASRSLVDTRTELDNTLAIYTADAPPRVEIVGPKMAVMEKHISELDMVIAKLEKQFQRMNKVVDSLDALLIDAYKTKGAAWPTQEVMWVTWPLEKFVTSVSEILIPYHRSLERHKELVDMLRSHTISFEESRQVITEWHTQPILEDSGWNAEWEDLFEAEVDRWDT